MFQMDFEGRATRFVPRWDVESGRKKGIEDNTGASGLSSWRTELSVTEPGPAGWARLGARPVGRSGEKRCLVPMRYQVPRQPPAILTAAFTGATAP